MNRLLEIGFQTVGHWQLVNGELSFQLLRHGGQSNILYAFVSDGEVKYIGKTLQPLSKRLYGYKNPGPSQSTNIKNNAFIKELLNIGAGVDILALPDNGLLHYGQFHINLAAGLEDNIITIINPAWNGTQNKPFSVYEELESTGQVENRETEESASTKQSDETPSTGNFTAPSNLLSKTSPTAEITTFPLIIQRTYYNTGFFNVPSAYSNAFGNDGETIDIYCGNDHHPITASINRRANLNNTPRIMGGAGLKKWIQGNVSMMEEIKVSVSSPHEIYLKKKMNKIISMNSADGIS